MTAKVLALIQGSCESDRPVETAAQLASSAGADLLVGFDPANQPYEILACRMTRCVDLAARTGVHTSTILVDMGEPYSIARVARAHNVVLVVLEHSHDSGAAAAIASTLRDAGVAIRLVRTVEEPAIV